MRSGEVLTTMRRCEGTRGRFLISRKPSLSRSSSLGSTTWSSHSRRRVTTSERRIASRLALARGDGGRARASVVDDRDERDHLDLATAELKKGAQTPWPRAPTLDRSHCLRLAFLVWKQHLSPSKCRTRTRWNSPSRSSREGHRDVASTGHSQDLEGTRRN
jgi:hypothetical protein